MEASNILILGENGTGKEMVARRVHAMSPRHDQPFIIVDATTIPEGLIESELFGHEKGAFTGADRQRKGRLELADKGVQKAARENPVLQQKWSEVQEV